MKIYTVNFSKNGNVITGYEEKIIANNKGEAINEYLYYHTICNNVDIEYDTIDCEENPNIDIEQDETTGLYVGTIGEGLHTQAKNADEMLENVEELRLL